MSFFDDNDPFEDIVNQFFGNRNAKVRNKYRNQEEIDENTYEIEEKDCIYLIIELPGYKKEDIEVETRNNILRVRVMKKDKEEELQKNMPQNASTKKFNYTYTNGILEVKFNKK